MELEVIYRVVDTYIQRKNAKKLSKKIAKISIATNVFLFPFFASGNCPTFRCVGGLQTTRWHPTCWRWLCKAECCLFVSISSHGAYTKPSGALFDGRDLGTLEQGQSQLSGRFFCSHFNSHLLSHTLFSSELATNFSWAQRPKEQHRLHKSMENLLTDRRTSFQRLLKCLKSMWKWIENKRKWRNCVKMFCLGNKCKWEGSGSCMRK